MTPQRTTCDCEQCQLPCRAMPGCLIPGDLDKIVAHVQPDDPQQWVAEHFLASDGALVMDRITGATRRVPTIVPASRNDGSCVFYSDGRCDIHAVAPAGCAMCDMHQDELDGQSVSAWIIRQQDKSHRTEGAYSRTCVALRAAWLTARPLAERRGKLQKLLQRATT